MARIAPLRALERLVALARAGKTAARAVHEGDDAVDVGILLEDAGAGDGLGHEARHRSRAVHAGEHADVVARAGLAVAAAVALEGGAGLGRQQRLVLAVLRERIVALELGERAIVRMDMRAGHDVLGGKADDLAELEDGLALGDRLDRHLVPAHDALGGRYALDGGAGGNGVDRHDQIVVSIEPQRARSRLFRPILHVRLPGVCCMMRSWPVGRNSDSVLRRYPAQRRNTADAYCALPRPRETPSESRIHAQASAPSPAGRCASARSAPASSGPCSCRRCA